MEVDIVDRGTSLSLRARGTVGGWLRRGSGDCALVESVSLTVDERQMVRSTDSHVNLSAFVLQANSPKLPALF